MSKKAPKKRLGRTLSPAKGPGIIKLPKRVGSASDPIRIGLLSWSQRYTKESTYWSDMDLVYSLERVAKAGINTDLILCSGVHIFSEANESDATTALKITQAASGCPVLTEWSDDDDEYSEWWLADGSDWHQVRRDQHVKSSSQVGAGGKKVLSEIEDGFGMLRIGKGPTLVVLICNEGRILARDPTASVIAPGVTHPPTGIPAVFSGSWAVLHPSHRPHKYRTIRRGWDLLGNTKKNGTAIFKGVTATTQAAQDKTLPPKGVFHAGPWQPGVDWQERASTSKFVGGMRRKSLAPTKIRGLVEIRYAEFTL